MENVELSICVHFEKRRGTETREERHKDGEEQLKIS